MKPFCTLSQVMQSPLLQSLRAYYETLSNRDRRALRFLSVFIALIMLWLGVWQPLMAWYTTAETEFRVARAELAWMRTHEAEARMVAQQSQNAGGKNGASMLSIVSDAAAVRRISLSRAEPSGEDSLRITIEDTGFSHLLAWLEELERDHGLTPVQITVEKHETPGHVSATLTLQ